MEQLSDYSCRSNRKINKDIWVNSASFEGVRIWFVLAYDATGNNNNQTGTENNRMYFLPRGIIEKYNVLIDERRSYNQPINDLINSVIK